jgi:outer membrane protein TolC
MPNIRPRAIPRAVLFALICLAPSHAQIPSTSATPPNPTTNAPQNPTTNTPVALPTPISLDEALRLANVQVSTLQNANLNERIAAEDLRQAHAAFLPKISAPLSYTYTSPALGLPAGEPRGPSFVSADGIGVYDALLNVSGDFDIAGRLRATVAKNRALLAAARAGTEAARRALVQAVIESYYGLALANAQRRAAEGNLSSAEEFERITSLLLSGGEVAAVDLTRAQLQTLTRRDELERARVTEEVAAGALRVLVGYDFARPITAADLELGLSLASEYQQFRVEDVSRRPEVIQLEQQVNAARQEIKIARAERLPSLSYSINGGFETDSLKGPRLKEHTGVAAGISLSFPIFDWGASRSREQQARLRVELAENEKTLALRGFIEQFYAARAQAASAAARINLVREGLIKAQDNLAASVARYRAGEAQIVEVTDAQTTLVEQRSALYQAIFDYRTALGRLHQATGQ